MDLQYLGGIWGICGIQIIPGLRTGIGREQGKEAGRKDIFPARFFISQKISFSYLFRLFRLFRLSLRFRPSCRSLRH